MKKSLFLVMIFVFVVCFAVFGGGRRDAPTSPAVELVVFAAASLTNTLEEIAVVYREVAPNVSLVFNFDSSCTLRTQIL